MVQAREILNFWLAPLIFCGQADSCETIPFHTLNAPLIVSISVYLSSVVNLWNDLIRFVSGVDDDVSVADISRKIQKVCACLVQLLQ